MVGDGELHSADVVERRFGSAEGAGARNERAGLGRLSRRDWDSASLLIVLTQQNERHSPAEGEAGAKKRPIEMFDVAVMLGAGSMHWGIVWYRQSQPWMGVGMHLLYAAYLVVFCFQRGTSLNQK